MSTRVTKALADLQASIESELEALREQVSMRESELEALKAAQVAAIRRIIELPATGSEASRAAVNYWQTVGPPSPYTRMTMKELVRKALAERFPNGATAAQLLELFHSQWGRKDIIRSSLSPQMSRLKSEGIVALDGITWTLTDPQTEIFGAEAPHENAWRGKVFVSCAEDGDEGVAAPSHPHFDP